MVKRILIVKQPLYFLSYNGVCLSTKPLELPCCVNELLKKFEDVFPMDIPHGMHPLRGIGYQMDLIISVLLPNRPSYRSRPTLIKEIVRHIQNLLEKRMGKGNFELLFYVRNVAPK